MKVMRILISQDFNQDIEGDTTVTIMMMIGMIQIWEYPLKMYKELKVMLEGEEMLGIIYVEITKMNYIY